MNPEQAAIIANGTEDRSGTTIKSRKWKKYRGKIKKYRGKVIIPYVISSSYNSKERANIARAIKEYRRKTCLRYAVPPIIRTLYGRYYKLLFGY